MSAETVETNRAMPEPPPAKTAARRGEAAAMPPFLSEDANGLTIPRPSDR